MLFAALELVREWLPFLRTWFFVALAIVSLLTLGWLLYPRYGFGRHVPGPWLPKVSGLPLAWYDIWNRRNDHILQWHRQYGPVVCIAPNEVSVATLESTKDVYSTALRWPKSNYFDHFKGYGKNGMRSAFATKPYEEHRAKRRLISAFYQATTIYKLPQIEQYVQERSRAVLRQIQHGQGVDVYSLTDWYALDIITHLVFGPDFGSRAIESACPERDILALLKHQQFVGSFRIQYPNAYHYLSSIFAKLIPRLRYLQADSEFASWCKQRTLAAMEAPRISDSQSLLRHLLEIRGKDGEEEKQQLDREYIAAEILDNINAAEATVSVTATYLIWRLTEAPEWQRKIRKELTALPVQPDGSLSFADLDSRVPSLEACLREVYRLHPASSGRAERIVPQGGHVLCGVYLPQGTIVSASVVALHRDERIFPDPDRFDPGRWLDADPLTLKMREAQLIPFGYGARICLGKALATLEIKVLIANLYLRYETVMGSSTTPESMKQCSTHDAVPKALKCVVWFQEVAEEV
ncbi:probable sterigmatocystin biosynthesis P450 monooxygenase STCB [Aspergillus udagawae]|uniref:Probable sterigmatocystin biosynthesis P450 monooxygenase STCB n=1 Tax=Aspergillus udagawae TaxID=91492 RepID=A0A8H3NZQ9_9EURO|nr:probable sterigmatocystin biosynthesis P450 monooxygenase STCB [Aspergillus udagawae]